MANLFDFKKRLGSGYFGEVWLVVDTGLNTECALKCVPPAKVINQANLFQEAQILKAAEHANIVQVKETGTLNDGRVYIAMEYLSRGSLEDEASGAYIHISRAKKIMVDVLRGLEYAHSKGIVHRDIKPANILIGNALEGKLSDFGLALPNISSLDLSSIKQQYQYWMHLAPEVDQFENYTHLSDIYACGITLYRLVNGDNILPQLPFMEMREKTRKGTFPDRKRYREFIPRSLKLVINRALNLNLNKRYQSAEKMRHALEQVGVYANWNEETLSNGKRWRTSINHVCHEVRRVRQQGNRWKIEARKGKSKYNLRRIRRLCFENLNKKDAERLTKCVLQDFVTGNEA